MTHQSATADRQRLSFDSPAGALAALSLAVLLSSVGTSIANVAVPSMSVAFDASFRQVQWVVLSYLLAATCLVVTVGGLGDRFGRARLMRWGVLAFAIASGLCAIAPTLPVLIGARAVQGLGAAILMALALAMAREGAASGRAGRAMGLMASMSAAGTALGPALGGLLLATGGWRGIFIALVPAAIGAFLLLHRYLPISEQDASPGGTRFDTRGALLLSLALMAYALAMTVGGAFGRANLALLAIAFILATLFVRVEARSGAPLLALASFRDARLRAGLAANVVVSTVMMATLIIGPFYLFRVFELGPAAIGAAMTLGPLIVAVTGVPSGLVADRLGGQHGSVLGIATIGVGTSMLALLPASLGLAGYLMPIMVTTLGYSLFQTSNNLAVMAGTPRHASGATSGLLTLTRNLGLITGASLMGLIFASAAGTADLSAAPANAVAFGMRTSFTVATMLVAAACIALLGSSAMRRFP